MTTLTMRKMLTDGKKPRISQQENGCEPLKTHQEQSPRSSHLSWCFSSENLDFKIRFYRLQSFYNDRSAQIFGRLEPEETCSKN